jgi:uncharacterized protein YbjT (DUF2867 family)
MPETRVHAVVGVGPVGRAVIDELDRRELPVRAIARHPVAGLPSRVEVVVADITDPDAAGRAMAGASGRLSRGVDAIPSLAGAPAGP